MSAEAHQCQLDAELREFIQLGFNDISKMGESLARAPELLFRKLGGDNETALQYLCVENQIEAVKFLIARGADVNTRRSFGDSPLYDVAGLNNVEMTKLLLEKGADPSAADINGDSILHHIAQPPTHPEIVELLISAGASMEARNTFEETPLHSAVQWSNLIVVEKLLQAGADANARDMMGETPLHLLSDKGLPWFFDLLLTHGAKLHGIADDGRTVLHNAAWMLQERYVEKLLSDGLDSSAKDKEGNIPADYVRMSLERIDEKERDQKPPVSLLDQMRQPQPGERDKALRILRLLGA